NLWFNVMDVSPEYVCYVCRMTLAGSVTAFELPPRSKPCPSSITTAPDGNVWLTDVYPNLVERVTTTGKITEFSFHEQLAPGTISPGPDGYLWFTNNTFTPTIVRFSPDQ